jgi:hypothetical protein
MTTLPGFVRFGQQQIYWCWAACIQMVLQHLQGQSPQQCTIVAWGDHNDGTVDCCVATNTGKRACGTSTLETPLQRAGISYTSWSPGQATFAAICAEIDAGRPVIIEVAVDDSAAPGSHAIVVTGYDNSSGPRLLGQNPSPPPNGSTSWMSYKCLEDVSLLHAYAGLALQARPQPLAALHPPVPVPVPHVPPVPDPALSLARSMVPEALRLAGAPPTLAVGKATPIGIVDVPLSAVLDGSLPSLLTTEVNARGPNAPLDRVLYPVMTLSRLVSVVEVVASHAHPHTPPEPAWTGCCVGDTETYSLLDDTRRFDAQAHQLGLADYIAFNVPRLGIWLVATNSGGAPAFVPATSVPRTNLIARQRYTADMIGAALRAAATLR